ncbi:MAG: Disulfide bond formation protein D [Candidatus Anoxychlamydiales bacterium]|nr:Disulfide bond formation protein D [Candidatus Anoxychlamydiales bacterium]
MRKIIDKLLVIITISVAMIFVISSFFINLVVPKDIDSENGLVFGNKKAKVTLVVFEDFKCKYCKEYFNELFPVIKTEYVDTKKIKYVIIPIAFINGSKLLSNAAIAIYELKKDKFFEFLKIISEKKTKNITKQELIEIVATLDGINLEIFEDILDQKVFNNYLEENLVYAQKVMPKFEVPSMYINGHMVDFENIINNLEEQLNYREFK